jgi:hypothetical protein
MQGGRENELLVSDGDILYAIQKREQSNHRRRRGAG